ncbi:MAG: hypothetical protein JW914_04445 [Syntrophaceae bacterium]|nr:hypothetical protein [Syntrophaceae bacterium]
MKVKIISCIVFLGLLFLFINQAWAAEWILCASSPSGARLYYDKSSIKKIDRNIIRVFNKFEYISKSDKKMAFASLKKINKAPKNPDMMNHDLSVNEIDCANNKHRLISAVFYDVKGKAIYSSSKPDKKWSRIVPNSFMAELQTALCPDSQKRKPTKK